MRPLADRRVTVVVGLSAVLLIAAGCSSDDTKDEAAPQTSPVASSAAETTVESSSETTSATVSETTTSAVPTETSISGVGDVEVTLTGPIAVKYTSATDAQKAALGKPLTGDRNAGTRDSGVVFQQFEGGVIVAKNDTAGTPAYITTSGKIRDAWNTERAPDGTPSLTGMNGSPGPLGVPTSDVIRQGDIEKVTFEHGTITENTSTGAVIVTVNGKVVPSGLK